MSIVEVLHIFANARTLWVPIGNENGSANGDGNEAMRRTIGFCTGVVMSLGIVGGTVAANADDLHSYVTGGHAWRTTDKVRVAIKDTLGNDESVYAQYRRTGDTSDRRLNNTSGFGATVYSGTGKTVTGLKACQNILLRPDQCDSWKRG